MGQVLDVQRLAIRGDCLLDGDDVHSDTASAGRNHLRDAREREVGHALKKVRHLRRGR